MAGFVLRAAVSLVIVCLLLCIGALFTGYAGSGEMIAYVAVKERGRAIYLIDVTTRVQHNLTGEPAHVSSPSWSPDGTQLVFVSNNHGGDRIYRIGVNGRNLRLLTPPYRDDPYDYVPYQRPLWSTDGERIIFWRDRPPAFDISRSGIYSVHTTNGDLRAVTQDEPDGEQYIATMELAFTLSPDGTRPFYLDLVNGEWGLYVAEGDSHRLLYTLDSRQVYMGSSATWSSDSQQVAFVLYENTVPNLYILDVDRGQIRHLTANGFDPSWRP